MKKWRMEEANGFKKIINEGGAALGYTNAPILEEDGFAFKDLNRSGMLEPYKDWRLPVDARSADLASKMTTEQIAGLMLYSAHQAIPGRKGTFGGMFGGTYQGKDFEESGANPWDLTDQQIDFLTNDQVRHVLATQYDSPETAAKWNNNMQSLVEGVGMGVPVNTSSDPRHAPDANSEYNAGSGGTISKWPDELGLAATFDPAQAQLFGKTASKEYRALGIGTALSPQIDLATEPRWMRFSGTFGEDTALTTDMARAYCDGFQTSEGDKETSGGWGYESVNAMVKHWPGGGSGESGRDAHFAHGKYAVYPGGNFEEHLRPFTEGAFRLNGPTGAASALMPYYTISTGIDTKNGENVGNSYSEYIVGDLLRGQYGYDGVVCTDWLITHDCTQIDAFITGKSWGVESLTPEERHLKAIMAGVDQFGGNNDIKPVLTAYAMGAAKYGEAFMRQRFEQSAIRILRNIFRLGLFENPYLEVKETVKTVGSPAFMQLGYEAQLKSVVLLKNKNKTLPLQKNKPIVYIPKVETKETKDWFGNTIPAKYEYPVSIELVRKYFTVSEKPEDSDAAIVFIKSPVSSPYSKQDRDAGGNGYLPISLQYRPYTADTARETSLAGGDPMENFTNRSYKGKKNTTANEGDLDAVLNTKKQMNGKPVIVSILMDKPTIVNEFEAEADAIVAHFGVQLQALLDIITGETEPSGLLPFQLPADMETVEAQQEDVAHDMRPHKDSEGHAYDFAYGQNWNGVIADARTKRYKK